MKKLMMVLLLVGTLSNLTAMEMEEVEISSTISITVQTLHGEKIPIEIDKTATLGDLKKIIGKEKGLWSSEQRIIFEGLQLEKDEAKLSEIGVGFDSPLYLVVRPAQRVPIKVLMSPGEQKEIYVARDATVTDLKKAIKEESGIDFEDQRLFLEGKILSESVKLIDAGVTQDVALFLIQEQVRGSRDIPRFTPGQKKVGAAITIGALIAAVTGMMKWRSYRNMKKKLIKKYNLDALTPVQNKVWLATVLASYKIPWYLHRVVGQNEGSLTDLVGDPRALAELYYGYEPTAEEVDTFLAEFFPVRETI